MKKTFFLSCIILCVMLTGIFCHRTYAFLSDQQSLSNRTGVGYNDSTVEEEFPPPAPIIPGKEQSYSKVVTVQNTQSVPCYIRVFVGNSDSSIGEYLSYVDLNTTDWIFIPSSQNTELGGYYYYRTPVLPDTSTKPLFRGIQINTSADLSQYGATDTFEIFVYEESIQSTGYTDYLDAWNHFIRE